MIFPSDSTYEQRRTLMAKVASGEISEMEGFREALRMDPDGWVPLKYLAIKAAETGDLPEAERYARTLIRNHPFGHDGFLLLAKILDQKLPGSPLSKGYAALGLEKIQFDEEAFDAFNIGRIAGEAGIGEILKDRPKHEAVAILIEAMKRNLGPEPAEVEEELLPHRLVHQLREFRDDVLERTVVDAILEHALECEPLLLGILKEFGEELLTDEDYRVVERALVLLGEIGNTANLPAITEFLALDEDDLSGPADWAFRRISFRRAADTLEKLREMLPSAGMPERIVLAQQTAMMPSVPGRSALLSSFAQDIERFPKDEREAVIISAIAALYLTEGGKSFQAALLERKYAGSFSEEARSDLRKIRKETAFLEPVDAVPDELSVYDICCVEPDLSNDDDEDEDDDAADTIVKAAPKPGRNEPCWCGSGKKYKKCHLEQDERG